MAKIADSLSKFRQAANDDITLTTTSSSNDDINNCDDEDLDDDLNSKSVVKSQTNSATKTKSNEIWLEYGCI